MKINIDNTICEIKTTTKFDKQLRKIAKQNKNIEELIIVISKLANFEILEAKYRNHYLINDKTYKDCLECHINPD